MFPKTEPGRSIWNAIFTSSVAATELTSRDTWDKAISRANVAIGVLREKKLIDSETELGIGGTIAAAGCIAPIVALLVGIPTALWHGFVLSNLWMWYAEGIGAPHISMIRAVGLTLILSMLRQHKDGDRNSFREIALRILVVDLMAPGIALGIGYFVQRWL